MPFSHIEETFEIVNAGAVYILDTEGYTSMYRIYSTGSVTPVGTHSFAVSKATYAGLSFTFRYLADATLNAPVNITFFGTNMPRTLANKNCTITAYHNGTSWDVQFVPDLDQTGTIPSDVLPQDESFTAVNAFGGLSPAFANTDYTSSGTTALGFKLRGDNRVEFRGTVDSAAGVNSQLFTLPSDYHSGRDKTYPFPVYNVTTPGWETMTLTINGSTSGTPGQVEVSGLDGSSNYKIYFDGFIAYKVGD